MFTKLAAASAFMGPIIAALFCCTPAAAEPAQMTAGDLRDLCTSSDPSSKTACRFYVLGVVEGVEEDDGAVKAGNGQYVERRKTHFCLPPMSQAKMVEIITNIMPLWEKRFPQDMQEPAVVPIDVVFTRQYPCR
jgi:hypothetical protein